jgi:hypothetical protein
MCDYSLEHVTHRPAKVGDKLVSTRFHSSSTRGFMAEGEAGVAICVLPGTELAFATDVCCVGPIWPMPGRTLTHRVARFRNVNQDKPYAYHDALEFPHGEIVLLTELKEGQHATVLQLPVDPETEPKRTVIQAGLPENIRA